MKTDRIFGVVAALGALAYIAGAQQIPTSFLSDPVGPRTFPTIIGVVAALCGLIMALRPDDEPDWPDMGAIGGLAIAVVVLVGYAYGLKPLGFLIPTAIAAGVLSYQISLRRRFSLVTGLAISVGLFVIFKYGLGLSLSAFPRGWLG